MSKITKIAITKITIVKAELNAGKFAILGIRMGCFIFKCCFDPQVYGKKKKMDILIGANRTKSQYALHGGGGGGGVQIINETSQ